MPRVPSKKNNLIILMNHYFKSIFSFKSSVNIVILCTKDPKLMEQVRF
jgi:hypothetical protein